MQYYNNKTLVYINGDFIKATEAKADMYSQSLHYGFAAFEGIRAYKTHNGTRIFKAREHFARLKRSCALAGIPFNWDTEQLMRDTYKLLELNQLKDAYIRPLVICDPNMSLTAPAGVSVVICAWEWAAYFGDKLLRLMISSYQRPNPRSTPVEAKLSGHFMNAILASTEAKSKGFDDALMLDHQDKVAAAPNANIFIERDGRLYTPKTGNILPGITRRTVMELCRVLDIEVIEKELTAIELKNADSAFLCGTAAEIVGIQSVDSIIFPQSWNESIGSVIQRAYKNVVLEKVNYEVII
ncbi:branched-chain amino acid aminotransferase [Pedobacter yulinensis]|uniref:branched-chain-amino-acid transaminase n=1 Tax=Pedobacter yulinensis TaxID=2126353 RepID=A0A2T3HHE3_9SPHI|nr:aminotransferase class IV [Pedobacter yulinensis]PST81876.1 branched-chain amino acid aminotransferase [Pedobacter yulinensis]